MSAVGEERAKRGEEGEGRNKRIRGFSSFDEVECADSVTFWRKKRKLSIVFSETLSQ